MTKTYEQTEADRADVIARAEARRPKPPEVVVVPPATTPWRRAEPGDMGQSAPQIIKLAESLDWEVLRAYAHGPYLGADGSVLDNDTEAVVLIFRSGGIKPLAWCSWVRRPGKGWSYDGGCSFCPMVHLKNAAAVKVWLETEKI